MNRVKGSAVVLMVAGVAGLVYDGYTYKEYPSNVQIGAMTLSPEESKSVRIPIYASSALVLVGGLLFVFGMRYRQN